MFPIPLYTRRYRRIYFPSGDCEAGILFGEEILRAASLIENFHQWDYNISNTIHWSVDIFGSAQVAFDEQFFCPAKEKIKYKREYTRTDKTAAESWMNGVKLKEN